MVLDLNSQRNRAGQGALNTPTGTFSIHVVSAILRSTIMY